MQDLMLIFDLDGTLWDSAANVAESWNIVLQRHDPSLKVLSADDVHAVMGKTMAEIEAILLPDMKPNERAVLFRECEEYENAYLAEHGGTLFPGVRETLKILSEHGFLMAIVSNCQSGYIEAFFHSMNMKPFFCDKEEWGNTGRSKAENIRLVMDRNRFRNAVYIGDTAKDFEAAKIAKIPFIHASYGFGEVPDADGVIREFSTLPELLAAYTDK